LFVLSAKSVTSLNANVAALTAYLEQTSLSEDFVRDLAFTLGEKRTHFTHRMALVADRQSLAERLASISPVRGVGSVQDPVTAFCFTGQGAQYAQMAVGLRGHPVFAAAMHEAESCLQSLGAPWSLLEELEKDASLSRVSDVEISQPACTAVQLALVSLLRSWAVTPSFVVGHSSGEIAAAYAAGLVSFTGAVAIAYHRGVAAKEVLQDTSRQGTMLAVGTSAADAATLIALNKGYGNYATIAAVNSPGAVTISGDEVAIEAIHKAADAKGLFARRLNVGVAYHSEHMKQVAASYFAAIEPFCIQPLEQQESPPVFISSVTGKVETRESMGASYWVQNLVQPVLYSTAIEALVSPATGWPKQANLLIEIGPHPALKNPTKQILESLRKGESAPASYLPSLVRDTKAEDAVLALAASLYERKVDLDFAEINQTNAQPGARVLTDLPAYSWNKTRLVALPRVAQERLFNGRRYDTMLGWRSPYVDGDEHVFRNIFSLDDMPWLRDHNIGGEILFPGSGYLTLAIRAFRALKPTLTPGVVIRELFTARALRIEEEQRVDMTIKLRPAETGTEGVSSNTYAFEVLTWSEAKGWVTHCHGRVEATPTAAYPTAPIVHATQGILDDIYARKDSRLDAEAEYAVMRESGLRYGPAFRLMTSLWEVPNDPTVLVAELQPGDFHEYGDLQPSPVSVDAATFDACLHLISRIQREEPRPMCIPTYLGSLRVSNSIPAVTGDKLSLVTKLHHRDQKSGQMRVSCAVFAHQGNHRVPVAALEDMTFKCIARPSANTDKDRPEHWTTRYVPLADVVPAGEAQSYVAESSEGGTDGQLITICGSFNNQEEREFAETVAEAFQTRLCRSCSIQSIDELDLSESPFCVFIDGPEHSVFADLSIYAYEALKSIVLEASGLLWLSAKGSTPEASVADGFLRTLRLEDPMKSFMLLKNVPCTADGVDAILQIAPRLFSADEELRWEQEFVLEEGVIKVPRLEKMPEPVDPIQAREEVALRQDSASLELTVDNIGDPSSIYFRRTSVLTEELDPDSIHVRVEASGINFRDLLVVLGTMPWHAPGFEGAGVVQAVGARVTDLQPGERVFYVVHEGGHANYVRIPALNACRMPESLQALEAASLPYVFSTALIALVRTARLRRRERVLIHAAAGGVGQACIMIAQQHGAEIFATAGSEAKRELLQTTYGIPADHIFSSRTADFHDAILCATAGKGVDVIVNSLSGHLLQKTWDLVAEFGRFVEIGKKDLLENSHLSMRPFARNATYSGVDVRDMFHRRPALARELLQEIVDLYESKAIHPVLPVTELPMSQITTGLRKLQAGQTMGKLVITQAPEDVVVAEGAPLTMGLSGDKTYIITGGTGGIGRALAVYLADRGARYIVLLGRRGSSTPEIQQLLQRYEGTHVKLRVISCDVGSQASVEDALRVLQEEAFPPVRGVIHGAFYLKVRLLGNYAASIASS
jgi:acyl transferase domain-containing protein/NADPH:quinone reductase-like Zn-dependent oxidoreductase